MNKQEFIEKVRRDLEGLSPQKPKSSHLVCLSDVLGEETSKWGIVMFRLLHAFGDVTIEDYQDPECRHDTFVKVTFTPRQ